MSQLTSTTAPALPRKSLVRWIAIGVAVVAAIVVLIAVAGGGSSTLSTSAGHGAKTGVPVHEEQGLPASAYSVPRIAYGSPHRPFPRAVPLPLPDRFEHGMPGQR